jgi:hypothetical protein
MVTKLLLRPVVIPGWGYPDVTAIWILNDTLDSGPFLEGNSIIELGTNMEIACC